MNLSPNITYYLEIGNTKRKQKQKGEKKVIIYAGLT